VNQAMEPVASGPTPPAESAWGGWAACNAVPAPICIASGGYGPLDASDHDQADDVWWSEGVGRVVTLGLLSALLLAALPWATEPVRLLHDDDRLAPEGLARSEPSEKAPRLEHGAPFENEAHQTGRLRPASPSLAPTCPKGCRSPKLFLSTV
jgi:hypothetical protein